MLVKHIVSLEPMLIITHRYWSTCRLDSNYVL